MSNVYKFDEIAHTANDYRLQKNHWWYNCRLWDVARVNNVTWPVVKENNPW